MKFEWDEAKNRVNMRKYGFDFADAWEMFASPMLTTLDRHRHPQRPRYCARVYGARPGYHPNHFNEEGQEA